MNNNLIPQVKMVQELHKLSDRQFSIRLGISPSGFSRIQRGIKPPGMKFLTALMNEFPELKLAVYQYLDKKES